MTNKLSDTFNFRLHGSFLAMASAFFISILFNYIYAIYIAISNPATSMSDVVRFDIFVIFRISFFFLIALLPSSLAGYIIASLIQKDLKLEKLSSNRSKRKGVVVAVIASSVCSLILSVFLFTHHIISIGVGVFFALCALILSSFAGTWIGKRLYCQIQKTYMNNNNK